MVFEMIVLFRLATEKPSELDSGRVSRKLPSGSEHTAVL